MIVSIKQFLCPIIIFSYKGSPDSNAIHTIANARQAGIKYVDVYMFPSPHCSKSASEQVKEMGKILFLMIIQCYNIL